MPELPEVEILVRHLRPLVVGRTVRRVHVLRQKVVRPSPTLELQRTLANARFKAIERRGKYLLFRLSKTRGPGIITILGHLGMTGRMYLQPRREPWPRHAAVVLELGAEQFIFEDMRYFGRFTLDSAPIDGLGPEPLEDAFTAEKLHQALARSIQPIKIRLLDQRVLAGVGNIYASEALFRAQISPRRQARKLKVPEVRQLWLAIREVLSDAIAAGSTVPLNFSGARGSDKLFYYGRADDTPEFYEEGLRVYGRTGSPCPRCDRPIRRLVQAGRSTFYCANCQR